LILVIGIIYVISITIYFNNVTKILVATYPEEKYSEMQKEAERLIRSRDFEDTDYTLDWSYKRDNELSFKISDSSISIQVLVSNYSTTNPTISYERAYNVDYYKITAILGIILTIATFAMIIYIDYHYEQLNAKITAKNSTSDKDKLEAL
jgi:hypothetical protein